MEELLQDKATEAQATVFAALADPTRLRLLKLLCHQNPPRCRCVINLSQLLGVTQSAASQHLRVLKSIGLVDSERRGYRIHYFVKTEALKRCQGFISSALEVPDSGNNSCCQEQCPPSQSEQPG